MTAIQGADYLSSLASARSVAGDSRNSLDQGDFIKLMVTQFRNQDPLKPLDADQMLGQLAQFGTVAGLAEVKDGIADLADSLAPDQSLRAAALVGRHVLVESSTAALGDSGDVELAVDVPDGAGDVTVQVFDASGRLLGNLDLGARSAGLARFAWDGIGPDGERLPAGAYAIKALAAVDGRSTALATYAGAPVESVSFGGSGGVSLDLGLLGEVGLDDVRAVYE